MFPCLLCGAINYMAYSLIKKALSISTVCGLQQGCSEYAEVNMDEFQKFPNSWLYTSKQENFQISQLLVCST